MTKPEMSMSVFCDCHFSTFVVLTKCQKRLTGDERRATALLFSGLLVLNGKLRQKVLCFVHPVLPSNVWPC